ncbi:hypothetical protein ACFL59_13435 [Planctomycetota bacterium]
MRRTLDNVGSLGDILKDAALLQLAQLITDAGTAKVTFLHTHAFQLRAACHDPEVWLRETTAELAAHEDYYDYFRSQHAVCKGRSYHCVTQLVLDALGGDRVSLLLVESDPTTHCILERQLLDQGVQPTLMIDHIEELASSEQLPEAGTLLALFDSFLCHRSEWVALCGAIQRVSGSGVAVVLVVYAFERSGDTYRWMLPPESLEGPVAVIDRPPHHLAVYATENLARNVADVCNGLGWIDPEEPPPPPRLPDWLL